MFNNSRMRLLVGVFILSVAGFAAYKKLNSPKTSQLYFNWLQSQTEVEFCKQQPICIVAYVAPWCPACHTFVSFQKNYQEQFKKKGLGVVYIVGADESRQNEADFQKSIGDTAVLDSEKHDFKKVHQVTSFPKLWMINKDGVVLRENRSAHEFMLERLNEK